MQIFRRIASSNPPARADDNPCAPDSRARPLEMQPLPPRLRLDGSTAQDVPRQPRSATPSRRSLVSSDGPDAAAPSPASAAPQRQAPSSRQRAPASTPRSASSVTSEALDARRYPLDEATAAYIARFSRSDESTSFHSVMQTVRLLDPADRAPQTLGPARVGSGELSLSSLGTALLGLGRAVVLRGDDRWPEQVMQMVQTAREQLSLDQQHHVIDALVQDAAQKARSDRALGQCMQLAPALPEPYGARLLAASMQTWVHRYPRGSLYQHAPADLLHQIRECRVAFEGLRRQAAGAEGATDARDVQAEHAVLRVLSEALPKRVLRGPQQSQLQQEFNALLRLYGQTLPLDVDEHAMQAQHPLTPALMALQMPARADAVRDLRDLVRRSSPPAQALMAQPLVETLLRPSDYLQELRASLAWMKELAAPNAGVARSDVLKVADTMLNCSDYMLTDWPRLSADHAQAFGSFKNEVQAFKAQAKLDLMSQLGMANVAPVPDLPLRFKSAAAAPNRPDDT